MYISRKRRLEREGNRSKSPLARPRRFHLGALATEGWCFLNDNTTCIKGRLVDLSRGGLFVQTETLPFAKGAKLKETVKLPSHATAFQQICAVRRISTDESGNGVGFGLQFRETPMEVLELLGSMGRQNSYGEYFLLTPEQRATRFLLIDHDRVFGQIMCQYATQISVQMDAINQYSKIRRLHLLDQYDVLIVNYDLEPYSGLEVAEQLVESLPGKPLVMMTEGRTGCDQKRKVSNIIRTISKWETKRNFFNKLFK